MLAIDVLIIGMATTFIVYVIRAQGFISSGPFAVGRIMLLTGIFVTASFYAADAFILLKLPELIGVDQSAAAMRFLHLELRWPVSALSMALVCTGIFLMLKQRRRLEARIREAEHLLDDVRLSAVKSESRFRSLLEQTPYSIYCFEFDPPFRLERGTDALTTMSHDARLIECNHAFAQEIDRTTKTAVGFRYGYTESAGDVRSHAKLIQNFVAARYRLTDYELAYIDAGGQERALKLNWDGVIKNGLLYRIWGAEQNILEIKQAKAELASRKLFEKLVAKISTTLIVTPEEELDEQLKVCLRLVCEYADADRAVLLWLRPDDDYQIELLSYWNEDDSPPWLRLSQDVFPWSSKQLATGEMVAVDDVEVLSREARVDYESYRALGTKSTAAVPLNVGGQTLGAMTLSNTEHTRHWSKQLISELNTLGELFGNTVWRIRSKQALDVALAELRIARDHLEAENIYLQQELRSTHGFDGLVGESHSFMKSLRQVEQVAATKTAVLVQGETGTGKELIARAIHARSDRNKRPLVKVNCAALPGNLIESELFGHEKGAFTGAQSRKRGRFDLAHRGTLFLDEIGDFPIDLQGKLLRVLQEGEFERLGGNETQKVDVRLIAATNRNLREAVDRGEFRADLYYRIGTFPIELPPLRDRDGDIPLLARHFVQKYSQQLGKEVTGVSTYMMEQLQSYSWPGNVRELEAVVQRSIIYATGPVIDLHEPLYASVEDLRRDQVAREQPTDLREMERDHIRSVLDEADWVIAGQAGAAARLGLPPSTLRSKMKKLGIQRPGASH